MTVTLQSNFQVVWFHLDTHCKMNVMQSSKQPRELVPSISRNMRYVQIYVLYALDPNLYRKCQGPIQPCLGLGLKFHRELRALAVISLRQALGLEQNLANQPRPLSPGLIPARRSAAPARHCATHLSKCPSLPLGLSLRMLLETW